MKIDPTEYAITFEGNSSYDCMVGLCSDGLWRKYDFNFERQSCYGDGFFTFKDALEALKQWREKQNGEKTH